MDKFRVRDLLKIWEELGLSVGPGKQNQQIVVLMEAVEVTLEEAQEAYEDIQQRAERDSLERTEQAERDSQNE